MYEKEIEAIKNYLKYFNTVEARHNLEVFECCQELGIEFDGYYPYYDFNIVKLDSRIFVNKYDGKTYVLTNSITNYEFEKDKKYIHISFPCGRRDFVVERYYYVIEDEWKEFLNTLKSYNPLDYDKYNNHYIYSVEDGMKLYNDYENIIKNFMNKVDKKVKEIELENKREEFEKLKKELGE